MAVRRKYKGKAVGGPVGPDANYMQGNMPYAGLKAIPPSFWQTPKIYTEIPTPKPPGRADGGPVEDAAPAPLAAPGPAAGPEEPNPLQHALDAQSHAEALQHQHRQRQQIGLPEPDIDPQQRQAIDHHVDAMGLSAHKARFLKSHPSLLTPPFNASMAHAYQMALRAGIEDDSETMDGAILAGVAKDIEHHHALRTLTSADARPTPENHEMHEDVGQAADELSREAGQLLAEQQPAEPAPPPPRRSIPMSAPVSRDVPMAGGGRTSDIRGVHLSAEERAVAHSAFKHLGSRDLAERAYAANKKRMHQMKANGEIQGDG